MISYFCESAAMLTKSDFLLFLDAPRHWWAKTHQKLEQLEEPLYDAFLRKQGYDVEEQAQLWAKSILLPRLQKLYGGDVQLHFQMTATSRDLQARADIVVTHEASGACEIYEVKASTDVKSEHRWDAAFQWCVFSSQMPVTKIGVVLLNKKYRRGEEMDLAKLFVFHDLTAEAASMQGELDTHLETIRYAQESDDLSLFAPCFRPKTCPCPWVCFPMLPEHSLYQLGGLRREYREEWLSDGFLALAELPDNLPLTPAQRLQKRSLLEGRPLVDTAKLSASLAKLRFPLWFLDYETFQPALPFLPNHKPYENVPFQFSLHRVDHATAKPKHFGFIAQEKEQAPQNFLAALKEHLGEHGSVVVWNAPFESGRNKELAWHFPDDQVFLGSVNSRMFDLMQVFRQQAYVDAQFHGSTSIKKVLPVIAPDLDYTSLDVGEGTEAMMAWKQLIAEDVSQEEKEKIFAQLWEYCSLDTFAMYRIWKYLVGVLGS